MNKSENTNKLNKCVFFFAQMPTLYVSECVCSLFSFQSLNDQIHTFHVANSVCIFPGTNDEYICYEDSLLPEFPLAQPAQFQIFESDCKINESLVEQLRYKFFECQNTNADEFISENLNKMLMRSAASVFSWSGTQGNIPLVKFRSMKVLIGS